MSSTEKTTSDVRSETDRRTILMLIEHCRDKDARIEELEEALRHFGLRVQAHCAGLRAAGARLAQTYRKIDNGEL